MFTFGVLAVLQIGWGVLALAPGPPGRQRWLPWVGLAVNGAAVGGWLLAKTAGLAFVPGLEAPEGPGLPDSLAALLGAAAVAGAGAWLHDPAWLRSAGARAARAPAAAATAVLVLTGMVAAGAHTHDDHELAAGVEHGHDIDAIAGTPGTDHGHDGGGGSGSAGGSGSGGGHDHDDTPGDTPGGDHGHDPGTPPSGGHDHDPGGPTGDDPGVPGCPGDGGHDHGDAPPPPGSHRYTATLPVDLSGFPGVTPEQQHAAEALVTAALTELPRFASTATAEALGYHSVGDASTGYEHFVNWRMLDDPYTLDPAHPESLVYRVDACTGGRTLEAAMFMLGHGTTLDDVPDVGGPMMQWHVHRDLCWAGPENAWYVAGTRDPSLPCPGGSFRLDPVPMIHTWIVPNECGPFAALEGVSGGQVPDGETRLCDHVHGSA